MTKPPDPVAHQKSTVLACRERPARIPGSPPVLPRIAAVIRDAMTRRQRPSRTFSHADRQRLDRAAEHYLRKCYRTQSAARASEFATELGVTPEYVSWLAKQVLGKPLREYLREKQARYAASLFRALPEEITVEEIAVRSGFGTARTLYRCFLGAYGMTPGAFRKLKK